MNRWRVIAIFGACVVLVLLLRPSAAAPTLLSVSVMTTDAQVPAGATTRLIMLVRGGTDPTTATLTLPAELASQAVPSACVAASVQTYRCVISTSPAMLEWSVRVDAAALPGSLVTIQAVASDAAGATASGSASILVTAAPTATPSWTPTPTIVLMPPTSTPTPTPGSTPPNVPTPTPDALEPNDTRAAAASIDLGGGIDKLSFWPLDDVDWYRFTIKPSQAGMTLTVDTFVAFGLDTELTLYDAAGVQVAANDDATPGESRSHLALTVATGDYTLEVRNRAASRPDFKTYRLETRLDAAATTPPPAPESPTAPPPGDAWENNYDFDHAPSIPIGEALGPLTFVCPADVAGPACADNDFFTFPVKPGLCYVAETLSVAAGLDPNLIIYGPARDAAPPWVGNDDADPTTFASRATFCAPAGSSVVDAYVLVGNVGNRPPPAPIDARTYLLRVAVLTPEPAPSAVPTSLPAPTLPPAGTALPAPVEPESAPDPREVMHEPAPSGIARIKVAESVLFAAAPPAEGDELATYGEGDRVELLGQTYLGWVKVLPLGAVTPGWMWGPHLAAEDVVALSPTIAPSGPAIPTTPVTAPVPLAALPPITADAAPQPAATPIAPPLPEARTIRVTVCATTLKQRTACVRSLEGLTVTLLTAATRTPLGSAHTDRAGVVQFTASVAPATRLLVLVPALGLVVDAGPDLLVAVPLEDTP